MTILIRLLPDDVSLDDGNTKQEFILPRRDTNEQFRVGCTTSVVDKEKFTKSVGALYAWAKLLSDGNSKAMQIVNYDEQLMND